MYIFSYLLVYNMPLFLDWKIKKSSTNVQHASKQKKQVLMYNTLQKIYNNNLLYAKKKPPSSLFKYMFHVLHMP
jgi:hypothetical protein